MVILKLPYGHMNYMVVLKRSCSHIALLKPQSSCGIFKYLDLNSRATVPVGWSEAGFEIRTADR